ncbi:MAG: helix-turn-helix domain-containing protein [Actinomycetota bacterium]|nr:helix-turn-helix domain-containing protein [Actinomycetota bacterium]
MVSEGFPRHTIRKIENMNFPLIALEAMRELCEYLDEAEAEALIKARDLGASAEDIATALGITRQGAYYKLKALEKDGRADGHGKIPAAAENAAEAGDGDPEPTLVTSGSDGDGTG